LESIINIAKIHFVSQ